MTSRSAAEQLAPRGPTTGVADGAVRARGAVRPGRARAGLRPAVDRAAALVREAGAVVVGGLDGLVAGLLLAYGAAMVLSGPDKHLGLPWPVEAAIGGSLALVLAATGATAAVLVRALVLGVARGVDRVAAAALPPWRRATRLRAALGRPGRFLRSLPVAWLGALGLVLVVANFGSGLGLLAMFAPAGAMGPFVILACAAAGLAGAARRIDAGGTRAALPHSTGLRRALAALVAIVSLAIVGGATFAVVAPGAATPAVAADPRLDGLAIATDLPDPGAPGPWAVRATAYGSGTDRLRPAFGAGVAARTRSVDASAVLPALGWGAEEAREWFWGFGTDALPLNGLAWLPVGPGPFPLVLIVHGNHAMGEFSEPGYAYLGEHLASHGFITVSVDEDFLNGSWAGDWGGREQLVRAWLLLLHLDQWRAWNADPASPFHGLVDLGRVALLGHSRGGEAAAVAANLASRATPPDDRLQPWPAGLGVRAVVAIAPSDGQYQRTLVTLDGPDFLTLHGGHDADATAWAGLRQYARTAITGDGFRAALWSYRSNHGQFNSVWGRSDHGRLGGAVLDLAPILPEEDQRDVARTAIGAFLEASLHDRHGYRDLFRRPMVGRSWLPADDIYLVRSEAGGMLPLLQAGSLTGVAGVTVRTAGFDSQRAAALPLRALLPDQLTHGLELRWSAGAGAATWELGGAAAVARSSGGGSVGAVRLSLANGAVDAGSGSAEGSGSAAGSPGLLDPQIELVTSDGVRVALPLSRWGALPPPLTVRLARSELIASLSQMDVALGAPPERTLQTYVLSLADFAAADPAFRPERLDGVCLIVDRAAGGSIWIAEVGLVAAP